MPCTADWASMVEDRGLFAWERKRRRQLHLEHLECSW